MTDANYDQSLPPLEPGTVLKGGRHDDYEILELTSNRGGFGRIYRAQCLRHPKRVVAIKEFHLRHTGTTGLSSVHSWTMETVERGIDVMEMKFAVEAKMLSILTHSLLDRHMPQILGYMWTENERMFYVMEFIHGKTLCETMDENPRGYVMPEIKAVSYIIQIAKVLHKAHEMGLIHADVSPNNIMLKNGPRDYAVLVDWGNANSYDEELSKKSIGNDYRETFQMFQDDVDKAAEGLLQDDLLGWKVGTSGYTPPQSFWGKPQRDVYSLAATLLYLLTDRKPKMLDSEEKIAEVRQRLAEHNVSSETTEAILHAMNIDVDKATTSIHDFVSELPKEMVIKILLNYTEHEK